MEPEIGRAANYFIEYLRVGPQAAALHTMLLSKRESSQLIEDLSAFGEWLSDLGELVRGDLPYHDDGDVTTALTFAIKAIRMGAENTGNLLAGMSEADRTDLSGHLFTLADTVFDLAEEFDNWFGDLA